MKGDANYTEVIYRIGNLVLLPGRINREASNKSFDKKKPVYKKIPGHAKLPILTQEVLDEDTWNQSVVKRRSEAIAKEAVKVWSTDAAALLGKVIPKVEKKTAKRTVKKTAKRTVKKTAKRTVKKTAKRRS
jgi:hypothetical protein